MSANIVYAILVTSLATSLGIILGGSLIVETIFEIDGFGRFFYQAIVNRDFNVVMFSTFIGSKHRANFIQKSDWR